ncbi:30S ribosomal protein S20 [Sporomusa ovata DSM 2662]|uniref:Small ribosomal subunit protein bS20 n=1 Tax=Sporomusa ovata TaxID=2378 RepID=A0A0U1KXU3_9FIRM|nr:MULTISPECIES: 30S ribosomal protein S20 [Sporomusa]EQB29571.1 30S ribosomal protein S20 [Sporomusa ovata DSM 2662]TWH48748.1 small subunit ribosomal protein S20 [Sporomusa sp. KB1]CQR72085.1 SSU ribosomal protein S20p [Sporomusa ovata]
MPNIKSSERSVKTDAERRARNYSVRSAIKTSTRKVEEAVNAGKADEAKNLLINAASVIDKAAAKGVIHKNAAARKKSRLAIKANATQQA